MTEADDGRRKPDLRAVSPADSDVPKDPQRRAFLRRAVLLGVGTAAGGFVGYGIGDIFGKQEGRREERRRPEDNKWPVGRWLGRREIPDSGGVVRTTYFISSEARVAPAAFATDENRRVVLRNQPGPVPLELERDPEKENYLVKNGKEWNDGRLHRIDLRPGSISAEYLAEVFGYPIDVPGEVNPSQEVDYEGVSVVGARWYTLVDNMGRQVDVANQPIKPGEKGLYLTPQFVA